MKTSLLVFLPLLLVTSLLRGQNPEPKDLPPQIILTGNLSGPRLLPFRNGTTAVQVILQLGGLTEDASAKLYLIRCGKSERIDLRAVLNGDPSKDRVLQPWDILYLNPRAHL